jgi:NAD(P)-dependent dehydrogenase (short-subunit alcohol dehydrogenase family)
MTTLRNKTALVTGASKGIGRATALALARVGAHVLVHYGRSAQEAESLVAAIQAEGGRAEAIPADLGTPDGASLLAEQVGSIVADRLDVLVLNAGISKAARIADYTVEDFDNLFAINVRGPFLLVQQLLPVLGEGSNIVVISSLGARMVVGKSGLENPSILAYASTKGALETLVKNLGRDSRTARHTRKCYRTRSNRQGYVEFYEDGSGTRGRAGDAGIEANRQARGYCRRSGFLWHPTGRAGSRVPVFPSMAVRSFN